VIAVSPLQPANAMSPILWTLAGIVTLVSSLQPRNVLLPMLWTDFPLIKGGIVRAPMGLGLPLIFLIKDPVSVQMKSADVSAASEDRSVTKQKKKRRKEEKILLKSGQKVACS